MFTRQALRELSDIVMSPLSSLHFGRELLFSPTVVIPFVLNLHPLLRDPDADQEGRTSRGLCCLLVGEASWTYFLACPCFRTLGTLGKQISALVPPLQAGTEGMFCFLVVW